MENIKPLKLTMANLDITAIDGIVPKNNMPMDITDHFAYNKNSKQLQRYMTKIKARIVDMYAKTSFLLNNGIINKNTSFEDATLTILSSFFIYLYGPEVLESIKINVPDDYDYLKKTIDNANIEEHDDINDRIDGISKTLIAKFIDIECLPYYHQMKYNIHLCGCIFKTMNMMANEPHYMDMYKKISDKVLHDTLKYNIISANIADNEMTKENFVSKTMPSQFNQLQNIVVNFNSRMLQAIALVAAHTGKFDKKAINDNFSAALEEENDNLIAAIDSIKFVLQEYERQHQNDKQTIEKLSKTVDHLSVPQKKSQELIDLTQKYNKLRKAYNALYEKYNNLCEATAKEDNETLYSEDSDAPLKIDMDKKYIFVTHERTGFIQNIAAAFPNHGFIHSETDSFPTTNDIIIVFITSHIDHCTRDKVRKICINRNIPFVHCNSTNVDIIKQAIAYQLTNNN